MFSNVMSLDRDERLGIRSKVRQCSAAGISQLILGMICAKAPVWEVQAQGMWFSLWTLISCQPQLLAWTMLTPLLWAEV